MEAKNEEVVAHLLSDVVEFARGRLPEAAFQIVEPFLRHYYDFADADDLQSRGIADLYGAAMAHWQTAQKFVPGSERLRVYNPILEQHGWHSDHTVIEIVNDDMPFLVDSVTMAVNRLGLALHSGMHPVFRIWRGKHGGIERVDVGGAATDDTHSQLTSFIHFEVDRCDAATLDTLRNDIARVLGDVRASVEDWPKIVDIARSTIKDLKGRETTAEDIEARAFLEWMVADHFTFLGQRDYALVSHGSGFALRGVEGTGFGLLRETLRAPGTPDLTPLPPAAAEIIHGSWPIFLTKANSRATVHRPGYLDYVGVKLVGPDGKVSGERRFIGLYTSTAYSVSCSEIPIVRRKCANIVRRAGFLPKGHLGKSLVTVLETYPRDELFQADEDQLYDIALGVLRLQEHQRTRLFVRRDRFDRFVSCLVYVPRDKYTTDLRRRIARLLVDAFKGVNVEFTPLLSESAIARIHFVVHAEPGTMPDVDTRELETRLVQVTRRWQDDLSDALLDAFGEEQGNRLLQRYADSFPAGYRDDYPARTAVRDIELIERVKGTERLAMNLYRPIEADARAFRFKVYRSGDPIALSRSLPMLEHLGVRVDEERPYRIQTQDAAPAWVHDFGLELVDDTEFDIERVKGLFEDAFDQIWGGRIENDDFNRLVLRAHLSAREVTILRAYAKYLRQVGSTFSDAYIERALTGNPAIARQLVDLFVVRFDPRTGDTRDAQAERLLKAIESALDQVPNLDEDRILRQFLGVINATERTNYYQHDQHDQHDGHGEPKPYLSFKFNPAKVPGLPEPKPMFEIWVYSPRVEGVHLRGGRVARGGLRWSDRREDFRTEVLGLMKAQMVKNVVIVPVGSKGGFVVKNPPPPSDREAWMREGIACYQTFLRGLLDLTDNLAGNAIVPPPDVVRHDPDDPYLVVAADKGTATFSDYANAISHAYGFWLDDAFASGGSVGYDHKKMAITARGAWESVKRHFREMGVDTQTTDFTVVGVGDMSGDVFGNGMLLSPHIRLVAAFDHRHVFLDPNPDPAASFAERARLFALERSSWADYDSAVISAGGGVYPRTAKTIPLSAAVQAALGIDAATLAPNELIRAILQAPVDLLYNGGIGTYVKAARETNAQVGDRANDAVRVNGAELRCKVIGEGGNLGFTQFGRIEFAQHGGRINTDAIDNSAGVDCSDHEVNIKILLGLVVSDGEMTEKQRNALLAEMTDEVGLLVLRDNYYQTQALSIAGRYTVELLDAEARLMRWLERAGRLNRVIEFLPTDDEIAERQAARLGLTSPERAVLLAYSKMWLYDALLESDVPEDPLVAGMLVDYFPKPLQQRFSEPMRRHPLRREILATHLTNGLVNRVGCAFVHRLMEETDAKPGDIVRACIMARDVFDLDAVWRDIDALDNRVADDVQARMFVDVARLLERAALWFLRHLQAGAVGDGGVGELLARCRDAAERLAPQLPSLLPAADLDALSERQRALTEAGVDSALAARVASGDISAALLDIAEVAATCNRSLEHVAGVYFALGTQLNYGWISERAAALPTPTHWDMMARAAALAEVARLKRTLTTSALAEAADSATPETIVEAWRGRREAALERYAQLLADLRATGGASLSVLLVIVREMAVLERA
ncbi:NAD-glutamate dehydrogenase [Burkholderia stagnalis]|uniref:NAD-glutamate dehydrogenase n=1 Tax=Burkholderia stagnalis TaxID=1503054 RepID=UPI000F55DA82|nr:NAD-glutamate dehydrogenase [Burkholderia stagnalis]RQQ51188.1 NAD-glutamate dehydrogenase [Burkholderia stagnalis]RQY01791.1 NAD-glutamate dehydrogenase [Burkholderia stagnalis]RQY17629.1 NAD-glutamate dehydrogenase [Burkholderia stagnalis]RQY33799.1 NAD-glutamate dehydrogenase [Burkholderia stagnalis]